MTWDSRLRLEVVDDEIIITLPGTSYSVTYFKRANSPQLLARNISQTDDLRAPMMLSDHRGEIRQRSGAVTFANLQIWRAANDKARELGWIV